MNNPLNGRELAKTSESYLALLDSDSAWVVRSADALANLRATEPTLAKLPDAAFTAFSGTLQFKGKGLAHANYEALSKHLSTDEIAQVFSHFGISQQLLDDYQDKKCTGPATCSSSLFDVCTSNC